jgi:hypothetical protein
MARDPANPARLRRAALRVVKRLDRYRFVVEGRQKASYEVNLALTPACNCLDAQFHGAGCIHEAAARLAAGDNALIRKLGAMLADAEMRARQPRRTGKER